MKEFWEAFCISDMDYDNRLQLGVVSETCLIWKENRTSLQFHKLCSKSKDGGEATKENYVH